MLKSFSVGHTAKGKIWWQAWEVDGGEAHKGTVDTIEAALAAIGVTPTATPAAPCTECEATKRAAIAAGHDARVESGKAARAEAAVAKLEADLAESHAEVKRLRDLPPPTAAPAPTVDDGEAVKAWAAHATAMEELTAVKQALCDLRANVGADRLQAWGVANG
jgi:hypothetical protein